MAEKEKSGLQKWAKKMGDFHNGAFTNKFGPQKFEETYDTAHIWRQRFFTSLAVGNGGGLVFIASMIARAPNDQTLAQVMFPALLVFAIGTISASLIPLSLWYSHKKEMPFVKGAIYFELRRGFRFWFFQKLPYILAFVSTLTFACAIILVLIRTWHLAYG